MSRTSPRPHGVLSAWHCTDATERSRSLSNFLFRRELEGAREVLLQTVLVRSRSLLPGWLCLLGALLVGAPEATSQTARRPSRRATSARPQRPALPPSASLGWANSGNLEHGRLLREGDAVRFLPGRPLHWGTDELVGLLERAGASMRRRVGARITVGDLSARHGGPVGRHRSHQSGRDADVCFFARHATARGAGAPVELDDYVSFDRAGRSLDGRYVFDVARNWALVEELLTDRRVSVERVFVSAPLRLRLLQYGREHGASESLLTRAALTLLQPRGVSPHDNHFHVRIGCPDDDAACRDGVHRPRVIRRRNAARGGARAAQHSHARGGRRR